MTSSPQLRSVNQPCHVGPILLQLKKFLPIAHLCLNNYPTAGIPASVANQPASQFPSVPQFGGGGAKHRKNTAKKLTTADISMPTDFKHVVHVGWTAQNGFDLVGKDPNSMDSLNLFLQKAGVSEQELSNRKTRAFIYDFIETNNVLKLEDENGGVKAASAAGGSSAGPPAPPPVPSRLSVSKEWQRD